MRRLRFLRRGMEGLRREHLRGRLATVNPEDQRML
jgi:hypothetical protein